MEMFLFLMATAGFVFITNKSTLFKPLREKITVWHLADSKKRIPWFVNSIFGCGLCMGIWAGIICFVLLHYEVWLALYPLAGAFISGLFSSILQLLDRK